LIVLVNNFTTIKTTKILTRLDIYQYLINYKRLQNYYEADCGSNIIMAVVSKTLGHISVVVPNLYKRLEAHFLCKLQTFTFCSNLNNLIFLKTVVINWWHFLSFCGMEFTNTSTGYSTRWARVSAQINLFWF
jgi:hypothetical protein